jgi:hypothetical protein
MTKIVPDEGNFRNMDHATRSLVSAIAAIKVPKIYLFRSFFITLTLNVFLAKY